MGNYHLVINEQQQTIQGIRIKDLALFQEIRFVVQNNHLEGWNPKSGDIERLVKQAQRPDVKLVKQIHEAF